MGFEPEDKGTVIELTYNYGKTEYSKGNAYAQVRGGGTRRGAAAWLARWRGRCGAVLPAWLALMLEHAAGCWASSR
jgi:hypothetical protein